MKGGSSAVRFGAPERGREASQRASKGRSCSEPGCSTVLSTYNTTITCWLHSAPARRHPLARD
jgi:hypothetical protein